MIRKIYTYGLILIFFASATALPLSMHVCKMDDMLTWDCEVHNPSDQQMMHHRGNKAGEVKLIIKKSFSDCCELQVVDNKIIDEFLSVDKDVFKENNFAIILLNVDILFNKISPSSISYYNIHNTSPPSPEDDLYIHNSILLI